MTESTLICTLGGQPQLVTFALDYLQARAEQIADVFVFYLASGDSRIDHSLRCLYREFEGNHYRGHLCRFRAIPLRQGSRLLAAIRDEAEADAARLAVFRLITELKQAGRTLHLCVAGGPRLLALMSLSAAMLYCGHQDKVWHIYTEPAFLEQARNGAIMHDESGQQVRLVQVPVTPWASYLPPFLQLGQDPAALMAAQTGWMAQDERKRCQAVWDNLTERPREVLRAFADGLRPADVARQLNVTVKTVSAHNSTILAECRLAWDLPEDHYLDFNFVRDKFRNFFQQA
jgi:CRISPR-associated protein Csx14